MKPIILYSLWYLVYALGCYTAAEGPYTFAECRIQLDQLMKDHPDANIAYCQREEVKG